MLQLEEIFSCRSNLITVERLEHLRKLQAALEKRLAENLKSSDQITN